jgi:hypothetical protein
LDTRYGWASPSFGAIFRGCSSAGFIHENGNLTNKDGVYPNMVISYKENDVELLDFRISPNSSNKSMLLL